MKEHALAVLVGHTAGNYDRHGKSGPQTQGLKSRSLLLPTLFTLRN